MSFPTKDERQKCWNAKDRYWECLEEHNDNKEICSKLRSIYESSCPAQWVGLSFFLLSKSFTFMIGIRIFMHCQKICVYVLI